MVGKLHQHFTKDVKHNFGTYCFTPQSLKLHVQIRFMEKTTLTPSTVTKEKKKILEGDYLVM